MSDGRFFATLNYSSCNEDWRTERRALQVGPGDRVLCVTGSGDRPLHLLLDDPALVVAVDANPCQNHLLRLKMAAMAMLPYDEYVGFLGLTPACQRLQRLDDLAERLAEETYHYWLDCNADIEAGVLYRGRWERYYQAVSGLARILRGEAIQRLFAIDDLEVQQTFVREVWDRPAWRLVFDVLCSRAFSRVFFGDPAFYAHVAPRLRIGNYVYEGMLRSLERHLARENFMLSLVFLGCLAEHDLPPYLDAGRIEQLRLRLDRLEVRTASLIEFLSAVDPASYDRFSLSDVPSYLDQPGFERLLAAMVHAAAPGARFCIRQFLTEHHFPEQMAAVLRREPELEEQLRLADRAFAYRFIVGTVEK